MTMFHLVNRVIEIDLGDDRAYSPIYSLAQFWFIIKLGQIELAVSINSVVESSLILCENHIALVASSLLLQTGGIQLSQYIMMYRIAR